jgi:serine protease Do
MRENKRIAALIGLLLASTIAAQENRLASLEQTALRNAAQAVAPSVVQIETLGGLERVERVLVGTGPTSGLIVTEDGFIVSSAFNFIQQPSSILVTLPNGQRRPATIVARDQSRMLVLLKVETDSSLPVPKAVPRAEMQVGQWTVAVGRAMSSTDVNLSVGILSAVDRIWGRAIQTDAKISPSNYGGPLVDVQGRVLGVLVPLSPDAQDEVAGAEWYDSGIGFAVPLVDLLARLDTLRSGRDLAPGILGISLKSADVYADNTEIAVVQAKSPAADAGLKAGDRILEVNGRPIRRGVQLKHALGALYAGDRVQVVVLRGEERIETQAVLTDQLLPYERPFLGILPQPAGEAGVRVRFVYPESGAARAGLRPLDLIQTLDGDLLQDLQQLRIELADRQPEDSVALTIDRNDREISLTVTLSNLPIDLPPEFPPPEDPPTAEAGSFETGTIEVRIPEQPNACSAYVPENYTGRRPYGLLVSLDPPGTKDSAALVDQWKDVCAKHDLILLAPRSQDTTRWLPTEIDFVRKTIDQMFGRYRIDPARIVLHGREGGAAMAYLVTFSQRELVRGVIAEDAPVPIGLRAPMPEPLQPLAILAIQARQSKLQSRIATGLERLRSQKIPVTVLELGDQPRPLSATERFLVGRWIEGLSRL